MCYIVIHKLESINCLLYSETCALGFLGIFESAFLGNCKSRSGHVGPAFLVRSPRVGRGV